MIPTFNIIIKIYSTNTNVLTYKEKVVLFIIHCICDTVFKNGPKYSRNYARPVVKSTILLWVCDWDPWYVHNKYLVTVNFMFENV